MYSCTQGRASDSSVHSHHACAMHVYIATGRDRAYRHTVPTPELSARNAIHPSLLCSGADPSEIDCASGEGWRSRQWSRGRCRAELQRVGPPGPWRCADALGCSIIPQLRIVCSGWPRGFCGAFTAGRNQRRRLSSSVRSLSRRRSTASSLISLTTTPSSISARTTRTRADGSAKPARAASLQARGSS